MTDQPKSEKTKEYEILYFLSITLDDEEIKNIKQKISDIITKHTGNIIKEEDLGKRKLAYMVKHARHGCYLLTVFSVEPSQVAKINHELQLMPEILRFHLSIKEYIKKPQIDIRKTVAPKEKETKTEEVQKVKEEKAEKVNIQELDRKLDELLTDHDSSL